MNKLLVFTFLLVCFVATETILAARQKNSAANNMVICEHGRRSIACPRGFVINIKNAVYGRADRKTCPHSSIRTTSCKASSSLAVVKRDCQNKGFCTLFASNSRFGDPCFGTYKYLSVSYSCVKPSANNMVICEHGRRSIACPRGFVINIKNAVYGRADRTTCPHSSIRTTSCKASSSLAVVKRDCQDKGFCTLFASNSRFGDPCFGTYKYLSVSYSCVKPSANNMVICEHGRKSIACPRGFEINIKNAFYGRADRRTCPNPSIRTTSCKASSSLARVKGRCQSKRSCSLYASNSVFGDPCYGTYKYLTVSFNCVRPLRSTQVVACENRPRTIRCSAGRKIRILYANYGRTDRSTCPSRSIRTTRCYASSSLSKVRAECNNKNSCFLRPYNYVFGDPCYGTYKYLKVRFACS